jgi:hypothetical protein
MNRNMIIIQDSQERTEAGKVAQGQADALKAFTDDGQSVTQNNFCMNGISPVYSVPCGLGVDSRYQTTVTRDTTDLQLYRIFVRWDSLRGRQNEVVVVYRTAR